ncbi:ATP-binding cassette domain-containing protein [Salinarimonas sp.]|uniref:ATP-binding cassette domain-containing protein n=1 Tax=Salinarimonas sp. TaxID=2766526 RepID=UPI0032D942BF
MTELAIPAPPPSRVSRLRGVQKAGLAMLGTLLALVVVGPWLLPHAPDAVACPGFAPPSPAHPLGCNDVGQDLLAGILSGGRVSLAVGLVTATLATAFAAALAIGSAWRGGLWDVIAMRVVDAVMALPFLPLVIVLSAFFGASVTVQIAVLCLVLWTQPVRELRAQAKSLRTADYTDAARAMGASGWHVCTRHILPELAPLIVPQFVRIAHAAILAESALSFLGLGDATAKSWGTILFHANARTAFLTDAWLWWVLPPGLLIAASVVALALIGHGIGDRYADGTLPATPRSGDPRPRQGDAAIEVAGLTVAYAGRPALADVSLGVATGETVGLIGESGSGKSTLAMTALRLLPPAAEIRAGSVWLGAKDVMDLPPDALRALRGRRIALVPQAAMAALNPVRSVGAQIAEAARVHGHPDPQARARDLMAEVELPADRLSAYPHELSGGQRQRVAIAMALAAEPEVLIADEPTTGLDVLVQKAILDLLARLSAARGLAVLFVTHDLPMIARRAARLAILQEGRLVETGEPAALEASPRHGHTRALFASVLRLDAPKRWARPETEGEVVLEARGLGVTYGTGLAQRLRGAAPVEALRDVSLSVRDGEVVGLVGASGSGKTTLARAALGLVRPSAGAIDVAGAAPRPGGPAAMVFQDPYQSLRPAMIVGDAVGEPLAIAGAPPQARRAAVRAALADMRLPNDEAFLARRVGSLSGGQRQRLAIARALVARPRLLLADEPTSMLDQSLRMDLLGTLEAARAAYRPGILFITHDLALAYHFCDRIAVMEAGRIVEHGPAESLCRAPAHPYTRALLDVAEA